MAGDATAHVQACDVFISHRGPETKLALVGHVEAKLRHLNLDVFVDYTLDKGAEAWQTILAKLRGAHRVLVVLSPRFEESCWCLEEVRVMAKRRDAVLPLFFNRKPGCWDDEQLSKAAVELRQHQPGTPADIAEHWRQALEDISGISGWMHSSTQQCGPYFALFTCTGDTALSCSHTRTCIWSAARRCGW